MDLPIIVSVRNTSSRLPGKCLADVAGKPALHRLVERLLGAREASGVIVATSSEPEDDVLEEAAAVLGVPCFRGAVDKLPRYGDAGEALGAEFLVTVDGDDILADPHQIDRIFRCYRESAAAGSPIDYAIVDELPVGATGFGLRVAAVRRVLDLRTDRDRELWGPYFTETGLFEVRKLQPDDEGLRRPDIRLTLDYAEDLEVFRRIFDHFGERRFALADVIGFLDARPEVAALNRDAQRRYEANIASKTAPVDLG